MTGIAGGVGLLISTGVGAGEIAGASRTQFPSSSRQNPSRHSQTSTQTVIHIVVSSVALHWRGHADQYIIFRPDYILSFFESKRKETMRRS